MNQLLNKFKGSMVGLAVGDALGVPLEFKSPGSFDKVTEIIGGGPFKLKPGEWTDDTSMALCLAASLIEKDGFDPLDQMKRYIDWRKNGYMNSRGPGDTFFDCGIATKKALDHFEMTGQPYAGQDDVRYSGNGSIMRIAPIPLFFYKNVEDVLLYAENSSKTTHSSPLCIDACKYMSLLIYSILNNIDKDMLLSDVLFQDFDFVEEVKAITLGSFKEKNPPDIKGTGFVIDCLEAALWGFYKTDTFEDGLIEVINLGDDSDTTGAVYGQIAGAYYGFESIPNRWTEKIVDLDGIIYIAECLYQLAEER